MPTDIQRSSGEQSALLQSGISSFFEQNGVEFGAVDIFCLGGSVHRVLTLVELLLALREGDGRWVAERLNLIITADAAKQLGGTAAVQAHIEQVFTERSRSTAQTVSTRNSLQLVEPEDLRSETIIPIISNVPLQSVVIVVNAAWFRAEDAKPYSAPGGIDRPMLAEDFWAPQLHTLAERLVEVSKERNAYVVLDAGYPSPHRPFLRNLLESIEGVAVLGSELVEDYDAVLATKVDGWDRSLSEGRLGPVLKSIDELPAAMDAQKPFLRIQMLHRAGLHGPALDEIENLASVMSRK
jgi:hypothetical protein